MPDRGRSRIWDRRTLSSEGQQNRRPLLRRDETSRRLPSRLSRRFQRVRHRLQLPQRQHARRRGRRRRRRQGGLQGRREERVGFVDDEDVTLVRF
jgi:hypothetical protein